MADKQAVEMLHATIEAVRLSRQQLAKTRRESEQVRMEMRKLRETCQRAEPGEASGRPTA